MSRLTDDHIEELDREGFIIVPDFVRGDDLTRLQAAQRRVLPTWEEVQQKPPQDQSGNSLLVCFPHEEMELYQGAMDAESIDFARKWLKTSYCQKLWIGRACGYDVDGIKEESVSSG